MEPLYRKVMVTGPDDLPKDGRYWFHYHKGSLVLMDVKTTKNDLHYLDWYLIEEPEEALKEELRSFANQLKIAIHFGTQGIPWDVEEVINEYLKSKKP